MGARQLVVSARNITKKFADNMVFAGLNLELESGKFYALIGKNGSGKSTLMRILAHRETSNGGFAEVLGVDLEHDFAEKGNQIAYVSEGFGYEANQPASHFAEIFRNSFAHWDETEFRRLCEEFKFDFSRKVSALSRGQQVQMSLILMLSYRPRLILLDEVTSVLDARARQVLMTELRAKVAKGTSVVLATNIVTEVQHYADAMILVADKGIRMNVSIEELPAAFLKFDRQAGEAVGVLEHPNVVEVGLGEDGRPLYLMAAADAAKLPAKPKAIAGSPVNAHEVFIYLSRVQG